MRVSQLDDFIRLILRKESLSVKISNRIKKYVRNILIQYLAPPTRYLHNRRGHCDLTQMDNEKLRIQIVTYAFRFL